MKTLDRDMNTLGSLDQMSKPELVDHCLRLQEALEAKGTISPSWVEALTTVAFTDQDMRRSLTKGLLLILETAQMQGGYIHLLNQNDHQLTLGACLGISKRARKDLRILQEGEKIPGQVLQKVEPLVATQVTEISDLSGKVSQGQKRLFHAGFPLIWNNRILGTLTVVSNHHKALSDKDTSILQAFSHFMAMVVQNLTLFHIVSQGKRQWENAIDFISDMVIICDGDFRIVRANKAVLDRFWIPLENMIGHECFGFLYEGSFFPVFKEKLERTVSKGITYYEEVLSSRWSGIFSIVVSPILAFGELVGSIHVVREITQEKLHEKDHLELKNELTVSPSRTKESSLKKAAPAERGISMSVSVGKKRK